MMYPMSTATPRARTCYLQCVADGDGVFTTALSTSDGCIAEIQGAGPPDGLIGVKFNFECERILFAHGDIVNESVDTAGMTCVAGSQFPHGTDENDTRTLIFMAIVDHATGQPAAPPAGTIVQLKFDFQMPVVE